MRNTLILIWLAFNIFLACSSEKISTLEKNSLTVAKQNNNISEEKVSTKIKLKIDIEKEKKIQIAVDKGHQPWRLKAVDVAYVALINIRKHVNYNNLKVIKLSEKEASVECIEEKKYRVHLKRLVRPKGIWTATEIEISYK